MKINNDSGLTMVELLVVVLVIGILSLIAVTVYTGQVERAKIAACKEMISELELAINRYEIDTGLYPLSGSGVLLAPDPIPTTPDSNVREARGSGYMLVSLFHSMNGSITTPLSNRWLGPYIEMDDLRLGDLAGNLLPDILAGLVESGDIDDIDGDGDLEKGEVQYVDPWGGPFFYARYDEYSAFGGAQYPLAHPFRTSTENMYNPTTFHIISFGRNGIRNDSPVSDDIRNF